MEIKLSGKNALVIAGITVMEAAIACVALKKAEKKEMEASIYEFCSFVKDLRIEELEEENAKLKFKLKGKES